jgi:hypothetical protein
MDYQKEDLDKAGAPAAKVHKIRITLTSKNVKPLEKCESIAKWESARCIGMQGSGMGLKRRKGRRRIKGCPGLGGRHGSTTGRGDGRRIRSERWL